MATLSCYLGVYAGGCVVAMIFFLTGRWPAVLEKGWRWPVILLWPLVALWPLLALVKYFARGHGIKHSHANANAGDKPGG
jgi:hypothetical protein